MHKLKMELEDAITFHNGEQDSLGTIIEKLKLKLKLGFCVASLYY
jgi:hypothetical protein